MKQLSPQHLGSKLLAKRTQGSAKRKKTLLATLMLTPMVDMFSLLVIFLLQAFSTTPEFLVSPGLSLPHAVGGLEAKELPMLSITTKEVRLGKVTLGSVEETLNKPDQLSKLLTTLRAELQKNPDPTLHGAINLEADGSLTSATIAKYMGMLASHHFDAVRLLTVHEEGRNI